MLDCEHHVTLIKALTFIYNTLHMYLEKPRRRFMQEIIFKRFFFKFFLHWHPQVRGIYHQLIIFKVRPHTRAYQSSPPPSPPTSHRTQRIPRIRSFIFLCTTGSARARRVQAHASKRHQDTDREENGPVRSLHACACACACVRCEKAA